MLDGLKEGLFPRLRYLDFHTTCLHPDCSMLFITSRLAHLRITSIALHWDKVQQLLRTLVDLASPQLLSLNLSAPEVGPPALILLSQLYSLHELSVHEVVAGDGTNTLLEALRRLWNMPSIVKLVLYVHSSVITLRSPARGFPPHEALPIVSEQLYCGNLSALCTLLQLAPPARDLCISPKPYPTLEDWNRTIEAAFRRPALHALRIGQEAEQLRSYPAAIMLQMPRFEELTVLCISVGLDWTDHVVDHVARSCPAATHIDLLERSGSNFRTFQALTCQAIVSFAMHCKRLQTLSIAIPSASEPSSSSVADLPLDLEPNTSLVELDLCQRLSGRETHGRHKPLVTLLKTLFQNLVTLK
ncbi:hypothetical protein PUNSTDRAFT_139568 [Punctularia strigosozonata HHB-11173 SS5]|uniref:F-box domain-containing protein n=1 Tax=Punctularia strigosozonata (strain HHB-11173) TaxID=741275 RepID=R7RZ64_PUNST|nr:uncharacterized protein PUNSTDRAFT_139568 [Punctularia strigosozonata HHB-11173 SS5]EIN03415.1 hypothetical protein PUNSTDRAFT_139568 [Punctularia strigosozonata HHB-11173 SS5]